MKANYTLQILLILSLCIPNSLLVAQSPGNVSTDLSLWLKADAGVIGVTPVTAWADQSANHPDAIQVGTAPDLLNNQVNFNPVIDFNGNNDYLQITGGLFGASTVNDIWVYSVSKADQFSNNRTLIYEKNANGRLAILPHTGNTTRFYAGNGNYQATNGSTIVDYNIWTHSTSTSLSTPSGTRKTISRDGTYLGVGSNTSTSLTGNNSNFIIGAGWDTGNGTDNNANDKLAELIIYTGIPSPLEQEQVQSYLAVKYGITKNSANNASTPEDERDYFASDGTTIIWDYSDNSVYHNDVTGIGRDDNSGLDQQKSKSQNYQSKVTMDKSGAFGADNDFLLWGNNGATGTSTDVIAGYEVRSSKTWKVEVTGAPGSVSVSVDLTGMGFDLFSSPASDFALLIDDDGVFTPNAVAHATGFSLANGVLTFTTANFSDDDFFAIAGPATAASPGDVPLALTLWLKADAGITGGTPVTAWTDQSGSLPDAIPGSTAPDVVNGQINFNPIIEFNGNNDNLQIPGGILSNLETYNDLWIYSVTKADLFSNNRTLLYEKADIGRLAIVPHTGNQTRLYTGGGNYNVANGANTVDYNIWTHGSSTSTSTPSGTRKSIARDGLYLGGGSNNNSFVTGNTSNFIIGAGWDTGNGNDNNISDKLAELIIYTEAPSPLEQEKIQSYLAIKYGITKNSADDAGTAEDERDYFASDGSTIIWDYSNNMTFHSEVTGIGRDDKSGLDQQKSKSQNYETRVTMDKTSAFASDKDFIVWGNDGGVGTSLDVVAGYEIRNTRVWKVQVTGAPGNVTFDIDVTGMGFDLVNSVVSDFALLIDDDGLFAPNAVVHTAGATYNNGVLSFTNVSFSDGDFFAIAGPETDASPGNVATDLTLWLRADAGVTGTTPVTAWTDQSGSVPDAVPGSTSPDLMTDQINFNPVLHFNGNNDNLQIPGGVLENTDTYRDLWVYSVTKADLFSNNRSLFYEKADNGRFALVPHTGNQTRLYVGGGSYQPTNGANTVDYNIWTHGSSTSTATPSGTRKSTLRDGALLGAGSNVSSYVTGNTSNFIIGAGYDTGNGNDNNISDRLAELIIYTGVPTPLDQEKVQSYLAVKYGITKNSANNASTPEDERDYFASDGTVVWDYSNNSAFHNDVAGIGRDDKSGQDQQKSKSQNYETRVTMDRTSSFPTNFDHIVWGHNTAIGTSTDVVLGYEVRSSKVWKVAVTGAPGNVSFTIDITGMGFDLLNSVVSDFALLIDDDGVFAPNAFVHTAGATYSNGLLSFTNVSFSDGDFFAIAGPEIVISPGNVAIDLTLWLKTDAGLTGTTPVTAWSDQSGSVPDAVPGSTSPDLVDNQVNFHPVLNFNGNNDNLQIPGGILENTDTYRDLWFYTVTKADLFSNNRTLLYEKADAGRLTIVPHTGNQTRFYVGGGSYQPANGANTSDYFMWTHGSSTNTNTPSGSRKSISRDGLYLGAGSTNNSYVTGNNSNFIIGAGWDTGNGNDNNISDRLAELIAYTGVPTPLSQEQVQSYLGIKYSITKNSSDNATTPGQDERDYFASDGSTITWDYSLTPAYHNEVIGLGRDDKTDLFQKQSIGSNDSLIVFLGSVAGSNLDNISTIKNDISYLVIGNNQGILRSTVAANLEKPPVVFQRMEREWKVTNTNFSEPFTLEIEWDSTGNFNINDIRLLVDLDGDFSDATVYSTANGLTFANGSIIIGNITTNQIPLNSTRYITIGSVGTTTYLPIELLNFDAKVVNNKTVELNWQTASEINNDYFTVERSKTGSIWTPIVTVDGAGNSNSALDYNDTDPDPLVGSSYYRLKQTDFDGQSSYSEVRNVQIGEDYNIQLFPNPTNGQITISGNKNELEEITIYNSLGQNVTVYTQQTFNNGRKIIIDLSKLSAGMYYVKTKTTANKVYKD